MAAKKSTPHRNRRLFTRTVADETRARLKVIARKLGVSEGLAMDVIVAAYHAKLAAEDRAA